MGCHLVQVADVHLLPANLVIEIEEIDGAAHAVLSVLVRDDGSVLEKPFHQPRHCPNQFQSLFAHCRVLFAQLRHDGLEQVFVVFIASSAFHQNVQLGDQFVLYLLEIALYVREKKRKEKAI